MYTLKRDNSFKVACNVSGIGTKRKHRCDAANVANVFYKMHKVVDPIQARSTVYTVRCNIVQDLKMVAYHKAHKCNTTCSSQLRTNRNREALHTVVT